MTSWCSALGGGLYSQRCCNCAKLRTMAEHNCSATHSEGATAPLSANSGAGAGDDCPNVEDPPGTATCEVSKAKFGSGRGLSLH